MEKIRKLPYSVSESPHTEKECLKNLFDKKHEFDIDFKYWKEQKKIKLNGFDNSRIRRPNYQSYDLSQLNVYRNHIGMDEDEASWEEIIG